MLRTALAFLAGHLVVHSLGTLPAIWPWALVATVLLVVAVLMRIPWGVALVLGVAWAWGHAALRIADDLPHQLEGVDLVVVGDVASLPDATGTDVQFELDVVTADPGVPSRIRLGWYQDVQQPGAGERWQLVVRLKRRNGFANPGSFDYEAQLLRRSIGATGYVRADDRNRKLSEPQPAYVVLRMRAWLADRIAAATDDDSMLGILQGLAVGETGAMSAAQWRVLAATGTTHLMAISGLHITMIAALGAWCGGQIVRWPAAQRRRLTAIHGQVIAGTLAGAIYSMLAGFSIPTQRTLAMLCVAFAARAVRREAGVDWIMGMALIAVLVLDPFAPLAPGAWLSFGAVGVILLATAGRWRRDTALGNFTRTQMAVTVGLLPVIAGAFGSFSLVSPLANAIAIPLFTLLIVPLVLAGALLAAVFLPAGGWVLDLASDVLNFVWPGLEWLAQWPLALWHLPQLPLPVHAALLLGALLLVLPGIAPTRLAAAALCLPALVWRPAPPADGEFKLTLLDAGQGLASVIRTRTHTLVFDTGPAFRSGRDTGELVVLPYLRSQGIRAVDTLIVSHGDLDHHGGTSSLVRAMPIARRLYGPSVPASDESAEICARGDRWQWDGVRFEILHPADALHASDNESSCVLRIDGRGGSAMLTGDIQREAEERIVAGGVARVDVVVAPHHGSRTSSTQEFVDATAPAVVLFAAGYRNRWGFPKEDVVQRWRTIGAQTYATPASGAIEILVAATGVTAPGEFRRDHPRYWRTRSSGLP